MFLYFYQYSESYTYHMVLLAYYITQQNNY